MYDGTILHKGSTLCTRNKRRLKRTFVERCHRVSLKGRNYIYLKRTHPRKEEMPEMNDVFDSVEQTRDNRVSSTIIDTSSFNFTEEDYDIITSYNAEEMRAFYRKILKEAYANARRNGKLYFGRDFHVGRNAFIKDSTKRSVEEYGRRLAYPLYFSINGHRLSFLRDKDFLPQHRIEALNNLENEGQCVSI
ncbi:hypothetical protein KAFR_0G00095 [Kazachstania africana CBS 2517]|uniref:Uncharacterized protein n=1 Tax=Kazachstania africana (strain ATCC 22294 / BCRC 22015 / CBS 2517 / CECT 1963 / NBRC 1671 / NRRL Y-8276) TaxID=1071382 RepID=H2AXE2_KAZAF|nr:hypothetical protein KAFR_0G00095 [Kazachstania africana CBS 2517]CCF59042.1 hypothetical protein KAFR_0G00095 [Kazachstania africana CBS 2517]